MLTRLRFKRLQNRARGCNQVRTIPRSLHRPPDGGTADPPPVNSGQHPLADHFKTCFCRSRLASEMVLRESVSTYAVSCQGLTLLLINAL